VGQESYLEHQEYLERPNTGCRRQPPSWMLRDGSAAEGMRPARSGAIMQASFLCPAAAPEPFRWAAEAEITKLSKENEGIGNEGEIGTSGLDDKNV
jgi:hypothetical protein